MKARLILRSVSHVMSAVGVMHARGLRVRNGLLHRLAAAHRSVRKLLWPVIIRKTPFKRVVHVAGARTIASLTSVAAITDPWSVVITEARARSFVDRTYDFQHGSLHLKGAFVASFRDAYVNPATGLVCTADGELVADSAKKIERHIDDAIGVNLAATRSLRGAWATVMCKPYDNYYHWFNDSLLRLYLLDRRPGEAPLTILAPPTLRPYQMQTLRFCLPANARLETVADDWVQVEQLVLPSFITEPLVGMVPPEALAYVRTRIAGALGVEHPPPVRRRLYISRAGTGHRQILNEGDLTDALRQAGFEIVRPEDFAFEEQVRMFRSAEVIVGARGAALTNMIFADRAKILELTGEVPFAGAIYFSMAHSLGHDYHYLFCQQRDRAYLVDPHAFRAALGSLLEA